MSIKTWKERLKVSNHTGNELAFGVGPNKTSVTVLCMQAEIDELRAENAALRKVLEQALEALEHTRDWITDEPPLPTAAIACDNAITAIQGVLKS